MPRLALARRLASLLLTAAALAPSSAFAQGQTTTSAPAPAPAATGAAQPAAGSAAPARYDLLIINGQLLDGSGAPATRGDVAIKDGRIAAIGALATAGATATRTIDAAGRLVTPGFIDVHSHAADGLVRDGLQQGQPLIAQGITTIVANPDGGGPTDLKAQRERLEQRGLGPNVALLIGHGAVRAEVLGQSERAPDAAELDRMRGIVRAAMEEGAFGLSSGLFYAPASYAKTEEVIALARAAAPFGAIYTSHIRDEGNYTIGLIASVDEVIRVAEEGGVTGIVSHMKALGPDTWGKSAEAIAHIEAARARGVKMFADQYPYEASSTSLTAAVMPRWAQVDGDNALKERLRDEATRAKILVEAKENIRRRGGPASLVVAHYAPDRTLEGKSLEQIARAREQAPEVAAAELILKGGVSIVSFNMNEDDIAAIMKQPWTMTSSDGGLVFPTEGVPHPRNYGAFTRKIQRYVNERKTVTLEKAVHAATGLSADVLGMTDRGHLRVGAWADLLVFDPAALKELATYTKPHQLSTGMSYVIVNGEPVIDDGKMNAALPGKVLRKPVPGKSPDSK